MKVAGASIQMQSSHAESSRREVRESLRASIGPQRPNFEAMRRQARPALPSVVVDISEAARAYQAADAKAVSTAAAERMIEAMRAFAKGRGTVPPIVRDYVLPITEAQLAHAAGRHAEAVALMRPAIGGMYRLGGSHTQQDVLEQLFVDAALKAGSAADIRLALERVAGRRAIPPERFIGWREAANRAAVGAL